MSVLLGLHRNDGVKCKLNFRWWCNTSGNLEQPYVLQHKRMSNRGSHSFGDIVVIVIRPARSSIFNISDWQLQHRPVFDSSRGLILRNDDFSKADRRLCACRIYTGRFKKTGISAPAFRLAMNRRAVSSASRIVTSMSR